MVKDCKEKKKNTILRTAVICLAWLLLWQIASWAVGKTLILPGPADTAAALAELASEGKFYLNLGWTILRCLLAMALSFVAGSLLAWFASRSYAARGILSLPVGFFKAVPVMAVIIYVILVARADWVAVIVCFFMCFPIVYTNVLEGLDSTDEKYLEAARIYGLSRMMTIKLIYVPGLLPHIKAALTLIAGISWKAVVAAEVLSVPKYSLGYEMINAKYYLETEKLFAYILVIVAASMIFERLIKKLLAGLEWKAYKGSKVERAGMRRGTSEGDAWSRAPEVVCTGISKKFGSKVVLEDFNMVFRAGKVTAVMGPSGKGKTTLARIIAGLETADAGSAELSAPTEISFLFQEDRLLPWLNVYDNIAVAMGGRTCGSRIEWLARQLEIEEDLTRLPGQLSGGMRHRAALARTFLADSNLLILDEPFRGLDGALKERIVNKLWDDETAGKTVILITHNPDDAQKLGDVVVKLQ